MVYILHSYKKRRNFYESYVCVIIVNQLLLVLLAPAQPPAADVAYCQAMADLYQRYVIGSSGTGSFGTPDLTTKDAMVTCGSTPASSIPILEQALKDNKITLPPR